MGAQRGCEAATLRSCANDKPASPGWIPECPMLGGSVPVQSSEVVPPALDQSTVDTGFSLVQSTALAIGCTDKALQDRQLDITACGPGRAVLSEICMAEGGPCGDVVTCTTALPLVAEPPHDMSIFSEELEASEALDGPERKSGCKRCCLLM